MMVWVLLVTFQFKHFIADYLLQGKYMLGKFKEVGWVLPLASHCAVHLVFTSFIAALAGVDANMAICLGGLDFVIHFILSMSGTPYVSHDLYVKAKKRSNVLFWWSLGLDQMIHHLTDILIVFLILRSVA